MHAYTDNCTNILVTSVHVHVTSIKPIRKELEMNRAVCDQW